MGILPMMDSQENHGLEGRATSFFNGLLGENAFFLVNGEL